MTLPLALLYQSYCVNGVTHCITFFVLYCPVESLARVRLLPLAYVIQHPQPKSPLPSGYEPLTLSLKGPYPEGASPLL